jgi:hypothetical protein
VQRPTGVTILAVLAFIGAAGALILALVLFAGGSFLASLSNTPGAAAVLAGWGAFGAAIFLVLAVFEVAIGYGLLKLMNWARMGTVAFVVVGMINSVRVMFGAGGFQGGNLIGTAIGLAIDVWIIWYLFRPHVAQAFGQAK